MTQTTTSSDTSPSAPHWIARGRGRIWYPVLVVLNVLLLSFLFYYIWRIMSKKVNRINVDGTDGRGSGTASSSVGSLLPSPAAHVRLHPDVLSPRFVFVYSAAGEEKLECSVCLAEFRDGEKVRQLPRCGHKFHGSCIDVWFLAHTTCPICRSSMEQTTTAAVPPAAVPAEAV